MDQRKFTYIPAHAENADEHLNKIVCKLTGSEEVNNTMLTKTTVYALAIAKLGVVNSQQLKYLGLFENTKDEYHSRINLFHLLKKKKLIKGTDNLNTSMYMSTRALEKYIEGKLPLLNVVDIRDMGLANRKDIPAAGALPHYLATNDIYFYTLGCDDHPALSYEQEYCVVVKKDIGKVKAGESPIRSDAFMTYRMGGPNFSKTPARVMPYTHYIETDSGKQTDKVISQKINQYIQYTDIDRIVPAAITSIDFSLFKWDKDLPNSGRATSTHITKSYAYRALVNLGNIRKNDNIKELYDYVCSLELSMYGNTDFVPDVGMIKRDIDSAGRLLAKLASEYHAIKVVSDISSLDEAKDKRDAENVKLHLDKHYQARKSVIFEAAMKVGELKRCLAMGLSVTALPNHNLDSVYPYIYIRACNMDKYVFAYLSAAYGTTTLLSYDRYLPLEYEGSNYMVLHNGYNTDKGTFFVENIEADLGGRYRAKYYFQHKGNLTVKDKKLICLVNEPKDALIFAQECAKEGVITSYSEYLRHRNINKPVSAAILEGNVNLPLFLTYKDIQLNKENGTVGKGLFVLDSPTHYTYISDRRS